MSDNLYWRNSKLDHLGKAIQLINQPKELQVFIEKIPDKNVKAIFEEFEDPYSSFNFEKEYEAFYWKNWKSAASIAKPDLSLI